MRYTAWKKFPRSILSFLHHSFQSAPSRKSYLKMSYSGSVNVRLLMRQKSAENSSDLRPHAPLRSFPGNGSSVTLLIYLSRLTQSRKCSKQARNIARSTQLQGCVVSFRPIRNPNPRQVLHPGAACANVSDLVHSIFFLFFGNSERQPSDLCRLTVLARTLDVSTH